MKEVTIEAVEGDCKDCMFHTDNLGCIIRDDTLRILNLGMCGETKNIYKIKEK